jgi:formylmethanofuran dehydrogenase subunit C
VTLYFSQRAAPDQDLDLAALVPHRLAGLAPAEIERLPLNTLRRPILVGDIFTVTFGAADAIVFAGGSPRFTRLGAGLKAGRILVEGDTGAYAATGMRGGAIEIRGHAGDFLAGAGAGEPTGMNGGSVLVRGDAGLRAADRLRRGVVVIEGNAGDEAAARIIAGTVIICGAPGKRACALARRGTLVAASVPCPEGFLGAGDTPSVFQRLLSRAVLPMSTRAADLVMAASRRFVGDMAALGKAEIFIP